MDFDRVFDDFEDGAVGVGPEKLAYGGGGAGEVVAGVGHAQLFDQIGVGDPGGEVDDLFAMEVDDAEVGVLWNGEGVAVGLSLIHI